MFSRRCISALRSPLPHSRSSTFYFRLYNRRVNTRNAFTLLELLVVIGIIATLMVLVAPAFTNRKTADDITNAAYTIKGLCEQARSYAKANHTYTWSDSTKKTHLRFHQPMRLLLIQEKDE